MLGVATPKKRKRPEIEIPTPAEILEIRTNLRLTQKQAADRIGVSRRSWAGWEAGTQSPSPPVVILIRLLEKKKL